MKKSKRNTKKEESIRRSKRRTLGNIVTHSLVALGGIAIGLGSYNQIGHNFLENETYLGEGINKGRVNLNYRDFNGDGTIDFFFEVYDKESREVTGAFMIYLQKSPNGLNVVRKELTPGSEEYDLIKKMIPENPRPENIIPRGPGSERAKYNSL